MTLIRVAHSPDSADAFMFYALAHELIDTGVFDDGRYWIVEVTRIVSWGDGVSRAATSNANDAFFIPPSGITALRRQILVPVDPYLAVILSPSSTALKPEPSPRSISISGATRRNSTMAGGRT